MSPSGKERLRLQFPWRHNASLRFRECRVNPAKGSLTRLGRVEVQRHRLYEGGLYRFRKVEKSESDLHSADFRRRAFLG